jgi:RNA polymerase sigma factor (sigma-70 family)
MTEDEVAQLYTDYGYVLFRRCLAYLGDAPRAQDALQEVFVRALRGASGFRGDANPRTWLCRIADHLCLDLLRRERRNPVMSMSSMRGTAEVEDASDDFDAVLRRDDGEALLIVRRLMDALDAPTRRLAVLHFMDQLTQDELARELGLSRRTIGKRLKALHARARVLCGPGGLS